MADGSPTGAAPWRGVLAQARHAHDRAGLEDYMQLATIRGDGTPANRTVVFRGFLEQPDRLLCCTDTRSAKVEELHLHPAVEVCWYFPRSREQFRVRGTATLIEAGHPDAELLVARDSVWLGLSGSTRVQFAWPEPGTHRADASQFDIPAPAKASPPAVFSLIVIEPELVDHLQLRPFPHERHLYVRGGNGIWSATAVNP
jgi:PPOX class probable FMN-dependent enzyme